MAMDMDGAHTHTHGPAQMREKESHHRAPGQPFSHWTDTTTITTNTLVRVE